MKRFISLLLSLSLLIIAAPECIASETLSLSAKSAVMLECSTKDTVFEKNADVPMPMASTTKIMTAIVVLENLPLDKSFTVADKAVGIEGTSAYLKKGDTMTVEGALYALLLQSANDVATALALEVSDSIEAFASLMNAKARELSLSSTQFKNPSGLPADGHYTTARDLARLAVYCLENKDFYRIVSSKTATVEIGGESRTFVNHNRLLSSYSGAIGVKTGYTIESGRCLIGAAERDGVRLVTVTLSAPNDWKDHKAMFDYGFGKYQSYKLYSERDFVISLPLSGRCEFVYLSPEGEKNIALPKGKRIKVVIEAPRVIYAPIDKSATVAYAVFYVDGKELYRSPLKSLKKVT